MTFKDCVGCGEPFDSSGYRSFRARCPDCATAFWEANAIARGRCPTALRREALAGFIGPKLPRKNKRRLEREARKRLVTPPEGHIRCVRCDTHRLISEFRTDESGRIKRPCNVCRDEINAKRQTRALEANSPSVALARLSMIERARVRNFGLTQEAYLSLLDSQGGVCKICREPETLTRKGVVVALAVDHCHSTGRVRGLLCSFCNRGLGHYKDDPARLRAAADYLERETDYPQI